MRLYGAIEKVVPLNDGTVRVHGIASTETIDDQGEIVKAEAMRAALPDYMRFPALREMHQLSAAGTTLECDVGDDRMTRIVAHVVDPTAVMKVKNKVYRGFSIGGRVTQRDPANSKTITALALNEISLVDRPANPEAIFDCWKASSAQGVHEMAGLVTLGETEAGKILAALPHTADGVRQRWIAEDGSEHLTKAAAVARNEETSAPAEPVDKAVDNEPPGNVANAAQTAIDAALKAIETAGDALGTTEPSEAEKADKPQGEFADPGYQADGKPRYKLNTEKQVRAAWSYIHMPKNAKFYTADQLSRIKSKIKAAGKKYNIEFSTEKTSSRSDLAKALEDLGQVAFLVRCLMDLEERLDIESALEGDDSSLSAQARAACVLLCQFLRNMAVEETAEVLNYSEVDQDDMLDSDEPVTVLAPMALASLSEIIKSEIPETERAEALVNLINKLGARHNAVIQTQMDIAAYTFRRGMEIGRLKRADYNEAGMAHKAVLDAGAAELRAEGREMLTNSNPVAGSPTQNSTVDTGGGGAAAVPNATGASPASPHPGRAQQGTQKAAAAAPTLLMIEGMVKRGVGHMALFDIGHDQLDAVSGGATCKEGVGKPGYLSTNDMALLHKAHGHLMNLGVKCAASEAETDNPPPGGPVAITSAESEGQGTAATAGGSGTDRGQPGKNAASVSRETSDDLAKTQVGWAHELATKAMKELHDERAEKATLIKTINDMSTMLDRMSKRLEDTSKRVEDIAQQEVPAKAIRPVAGSITKSADNRVAGQGDGSAISLDEVTKALAAMSPEAQTLTMIKAAKANPLHLPGRTDGPAPFGAARPAKS